MSKGTADLRRQWKEPGRVSRRITQVARRMCEEYGTPSLGNLRDPLNEAAYIVITFQTDIPRARLVWRALRNKYPEWSSLVAAPEEQVAKVLRPAGLHVIRARLLRALLGAVKERFGGYSLRQLKITNTERAERILRELPGLDRKGARCVLLYSLGRPVFPVDSNTHRFALRYGILRSGTPYRRASVHDALQNIVPDELRHDLHVNLVVHGQKTCTLRTPRCDKCPVRISCLRVGVPGTSERNQLGADLLARRGSRVKSAGWATGRPT